MNPSSPAPSPINSQAVPKKPRKLRQATIGAILGLLTLFLPLYPILYLLQLWLQPALSFLPGVIITGLLIIIVTLLTRKKFPTFAYTYLATSLIVLAFLTYLFQSFDFIN